MIEPGTRPRATRVLGAGLLDVLPDEQVDHHGLRLNRQHFVFEQVQVLPGADRRKSEVVDLCRPEARLCEGRKVAEVRIDADTERIADGGVDRFVTAETPCRSGR